jgi:septal ring factor EnvC (AmiA/AmiB activator)
MHTYRIQEAERNGRDNVEGILGIVVLVVLIACGLASVPLPSRIASEEASISRHRDQLRAAEIQNLQTRDSSLESELKKLTKLLESTRADLTSFRQVHDTLISQVAVTTGKMQEIESNMQDTKAQAGKLSEYAALQERLQKERDEALTQAKDAAERVRDLTLRLQRAGVYP